MSTRLQEPRKNLQRLTRPMRLWETNKRRGSTIPLECLEMSSSKLDLKIHLEAEVSVREDLEDFLASRASMTNLDREDNKVEQEILLVIYLKSSRNSSADSKDREEAEEPKHK